MADCRWAKAVRPSYGYDGVPLGRQLKLDSGLLEITYRTGAKVILQGPVTYEMEANGGYLSVGKLTGKLDKEGGGRRTEGESSLHPSSFILHPFVIRTPTAIVTDLGTEFGVEVSSEGATDAQVFVGKVQIATAGGQRGGNEQTRLIRAGQYTHVGKEMMLCVDERDFEVRAKQFTRIMPAAVADGRCLRRTGALHESGRLLPHGPVAGDRQEGPLRAGRFGARRPPRRGVSGRNIRQAFGPGQVRRRTGSSRYDGLRICVREELSQDGQRAAFRFGLGLARGARSVGGDRFQLVSPPHGRGDWTIRLGRQQCLELSRRYISQTARWRTFANAACRCLEVCGITWLSWPTAPFCTSIATAWRSTRFLRDIARQPVRECLSVGCGMNRDGTGPRPDNNGLVWNGRLDELAVFNYALSAEQVRQLYTAKATAAGRRTSP